MNTGPITRTPTLNELYGPSSHGSAPPPPRGVNWTYIIIGATALAGGFAIVYFYSKHSQEEMSVQSLNLHQTQMSALDSQATAHRDGQDKMTSRLDRFEQNTNRAIQLLENIVPAGKVLIEDITPIVETINAETNNQKSITKQ